MSPRRILLAYLNTGGGHQSAAVAVAQALREEYGEAVRVDAVDVTTERFAWPLSRLDTVYDWLVRLKGKPWGLLYHATDAPQRMATINRAWRRLAARPVSQMLNDSRPDIAVCCHPLLKAPMARAMKGHPRGARLITLVTDLACGHAAWFQPPAGDCLVPTQSIRRKALACGLAPDAVEVTGLPVRAGFLHTAERGPVARTKLGLDAERRLVLLLSGADGMGSFRSLLRAVASDDLDAQFVAITGRNEGLRANLSSQRWPATVHIKGFVRNVHDWMSAADVLITKAGPATIAEALVVGLPMILSDAIPGQEPANVRYVEEIGAGIWAPDPTQAAKAVHALLSPGNEKLQKMAIQARRASCPEAARSVARMIWQSANEPCAAGGRRPTETVPTARAQTARTHLTTKE